MKKKGTASAARFACAVVGAIAIMTGCHKVTGGGWIDGVNGGKATFAFQGQCVRQDPDGSGEQSFFYRGQFQFNDRLAGVKVHAEMLRFALFGDESQSCEESAEFFGSFDPRNEASFSAVCQSPTGEFGFITVDVVDEGTPGSLSGDFINISIDGACTSDGQPYSNSGIIRGGNIVVHGHKDTGSGARKKS